MSMIVAESLTHRFGSEVALYGVDLTLDVGERIAVLGDNGAGKTTLLRILATALHPTSGRLQIGGVDAFRDRARLRRHIGYVSHSLGLYPALSAAENLEFFCDLHGIDRGRAYEALDVVRLQRIASRPAGALSRGMQQRLAIARAILHEPRLLVLDEPDASLGGDAAEVLDAVMRGRTVVFATHDHALAGRLCSRSMVLRHGNSARAAARLRVVQRAGFASRSRWHARISARNGAHARWCLRSRSSSCSPS